MDVKMKHETAEVLVIGSGGAGLRCAIELHDNKVDVLVVGKCKKREAHTIMATGGINAALANMDPKDSWELHAADTIKDGGMINDGVGVEILCKNAPHAVKELHKWGTKFHLEKDKKTITQRFFGAATYRRAAFVGDHTGKAILNTLVNQTLKRKIRFKSETYIFSLLTHNGKVNGALGLEMKTGKLVCIHAKKVVLATGGHSRMFGRSSSHFWENNGDGIALGFDVGTQFMDMEMFQFHPTGMLWPKEASGLLVTEAVRGEGGILTNAKGERFMVKYDKERMELSARDVVARGIYMEVEQGRGTKRGGCWLDISHRSLAYIKRRLPKMRKQFLDYCKLDIAKKKMEIAPTAHYSMGGIHIDHKTGKTGIPNLYGIGEVTAGMHGGNRLGGNSLAEITVFGRLTGQQVLKDVKKQKKLLPLDEELIEAKCTQFMQLATTRKGVNPISVKKELQEMMWHHVGVVRNERLMKAGLKKLQKYKRMDLKISGGLKMNEKLIAALDVMNMLPTCEMIIECALKRKESRAAHYRSDYKKTLKSWEKNILCTPTMSGFKMTTQPVVRPKNKKVRKWLDSGHKRSTKLLE